MLPGALDVERLHPFLRGVTDDVFRPRPIFPRFPPLSPDPEERLVRPELRTCATGFDSKGSRFSNFTSIT